MQAEAHHSIRALANTLANNVVIKVLDSATMSAELDVLGRRSSFQFVNLSFVKRMSLFLCSICSRGLTFLVIFWFWLIGLGLNEFGSLLTSLSSLSRLASLSLIQL